MVLLVLFQRRHLLQYLPSFLSAGSSKTMSPILLRTFFLLSSIILIEWILTIWDFSLSLLSLLESLTVSPSSASSKLSSVFNSASSSACFSWSAARLCSFIVWGPPTCGSLLGFCNLYGYFIFFINHLFVVGMVLIDVCGLEFLADGR